MHESRTFCPKGYIAGIDNAGRVTLLELSIRELFHKNKREVSKIQYVLFIHVRMQHVHCASALTAVLLSCDI